MKINNLYLSFLQTRRFFSILFTIFKHSIIRLFKGSNNSVHNTKRGIKSVDSTPERFRLLIEELGPTFVKLGQILADRPDVLPLAYRLELKKLQSATKEFRSDFAIDIIQHELGKPISEIFQSFDKNPIGSASIGQVYKAVLMSGEKVVIKVQRPNISDTIKLDLKLMKFFAYRLSKGKSTFRQLNLVAVVESFSESIFYELDYIVEMNNILIFRDMFKDSRTVHIPKPYKEFTTTKVLVMEFMEGYSPNDRVSLDKHNIDRGVVMQNGAESIFKMILEHGIYHADPHSGNILVRDDGSISYIDFGMIGVLRKRELEFIAKYAYGYSKRDEELITKAFLDLCGEKFFENESELRFDIKKMLLRNFGNINMDVENFARTLQDSMYLVLKYKLTLPAEFYLLIKTTLILEKFSEIMGKDVNLSEIILPYSHRIIEENYSVKSVAKKLKETLRNYLNLLESSPKDIAEILYKIKQGKILHEVNIEKSDMFLVSIRKTSLRIAYVLILCGVFLGSSIMYIVDYDNILIVATLYVSLSMIVLLVLKWLFIK